MTVLDKVIAFAEFNKIEFDNIAFECEWNNFNVYKPIFDSDEGYYIGLPKYILVDRFGNISLAKDNEVYEILDSLPDEY